ncbi:Uncharacterised protein [uncultured archaeon]|nr:Uncharacterised protein [uncultured archaeon]
MAAQSKSDRFVFVRFNNLNKGLQAEAIERLHSVYSGNSANKKDILFFGTMIQKEKLCVLYRGKLIGAMAYAVNPHGVYITEIWAKPSREFLKQKGETIGIALARVAERLAKKKGLEVNAVWINSGRRFNARRIGRRTASAKTVLKLNSTAGRKQKLRG